MYLQMFTLYFGIAAINVAMAPYEAFKQNNTTTTTAEGRARSESTSSVASNESKMSRDSAYDSGYGSDNEQHDAHDKTEHSQPPVLLQSTTDQSDPSFTIRHEQLLYVCIAIPLTYIVDKELLVLPLIGLALFATIVFLLAPVAHVQRMLGPTFLNIEWTAKKDVQSQHGEVDKGMEAEEQDHHHHRCIDAVDTKQDLVSIVQVVYEDAQVQTEALREPDYVDQMTSTKAAQYESQAVQTEEPSPASSRYDDQETTAPLDSDKIASTQTSDKAFLPATTEQHTMKHHPGTLRTRVRRPGIHPSERPAPTPIIDNEEIDLARQFSIPTVAAKTAADVKDLEDADVFPVMPASAPGSPATQPGFDPWKHVRATIVLSDGIEVPNTHNWIETTRKHVYVSKAAIQSVVDGVPQYYHHGLWLIVTESGAYVCQWLSQNSIWWCEEHGFGFCEEDSGSTEPIRAFYGDPYSGDAGMIGPQRTKGLAGPYYHDALVKNEKVMMECFPKYKAEVERREAEEELRKEAEAQLRKVMEEMKRAEEEERQHQECQEFELAQFLEAERVRAEQQAGWQARQRDYANRSQQSGYGPRYEHQRTYAPRQHQQPSYAPRQQQQPRPQRKSREQIAEENRIKAAKEMEEWAKGGFEKKAAKFGEKLF
jgi:hypothetical protein